MQRIKKKNLEKGGGEGGGIYLLIHTTCINSWENMSSHNYLISPVHKNVDMIF
jgi:hypothetical protein